MEKQLKDEEYKIVDDEPIKRAPNKNMQQKPPEEVEEFRIIEDEEDRKMRELNEFLTELVSNMQKEEEREQKYGPLCGIISEMRFVKDQMGNNALLFEQPARDYAITGNIMKSVVYASVEDGIDKEFDYRSFQGFVTINLMKNGAKRYNANDLMDVYAFLKSDIQKNKTNKPSLNLLFRKNEDMQRVDVFADVKLGDKKIEEEIPFTHLNLYCKHLNDALNKKDSKKETNSRERNK